MYHVPHFEQGTVTTAAGWSLHYLYMSISEIRIVCVGHKLFIIYTGLGEYPIDIYRESVVLPYSLMMLHTSVISNRCVHNVTGNQLNLKSH